MRAVSVGAWVLVGLVGGGAAAACLAMVAVKQRFQGARYD